MKKKRHDRRVGMLQPPNCGEFPPLVLCCLNQNQFLSKRPLVLLYHVLALFDISDVPSKLFVYRFESSECAVAETCCHRQGWASGFKPYSVEELLTFCFKGSRVRCCWPRRRDDSSRYCAAN